MAIIQRGPGLTRGKRSHRVASVNPRSPVPKILLLAVLLAAFATGCSLLPERIITLCTNRPEMAAYAEYFNTLPSDYQVVISYQRNPVESVLSKSRDADLVLGPWLSGSACRRLLDPVDRLFRKGQIAREDFYSGLLSAGMKESRQVMLPFSFNLPAVVFLSNGLAGDIPNLVVSVQYLSEQSGRFNQSVRGRLVRQGFSPLWDHEFLYTAAALFGAQFRETPEGSVHWNSARLQEMQAFSSTWIEETNLDYDQDAQFSRKYLYEPMPRLLDEGRILFYTTDSSQLLGSLENQAEEVDFRWLGSGNRIPVSEEVLYFGIPKRSRNKRGARLFLAWIFQPETQSRLLKINQEKRLNTFGLAGGFSSLREVTEREFPQYYRQLLGRIPSEELLVVPKALPASWGELKEQVVIPWLVDYVLHRLDEELLAQRLGEFREEAAGK